MTESLDEDAMDDWLERPGWRRILRERLHQRIAAAPKVDPLAMWTAHQHTLMTMAKAQAAVASNMREPHRESGVNLTAGLVLHAVAGPREIALGQIPGLLGRPRTTVSSALARLAELGYVVQRRHERDRRRVIVAVTRPGLRLAMQIDSLLGGIERAAIHDAVGAADDETPRTTGQYAAELEAMTALDADAHAFAAAVAAQAVPYLTTEQEWRAEARAMDWQFGDSWRWMLAYGTGWRAGTAGRTVSEQPRPYLAASSSCSSARIAAPSAGSAWSQPQTCRTPCATSRRSSSRASHATSPVWPPCPIAACIRARSTDTTTSPRWTRAPGGRGNASGRGPPGRPG
ncbi:MAG: MarR family transcriptional regulator [Chloroflexi bacterium]|nr:MarR family transcriptional regulator [Chloroflexota bacterium]